MPAAPLVPTTAVTIILQCGDLSGFSVSKTDHYREYEFDYCFWEVEITWKRVNEANANIGILPGLDCSDYIYCIDFIYF